MYVFCTSKWCREKNLYSLYDKFSCFWRFKEHKIVILSAKSSHLSICEEFLKADGTVQACQHRCRCEEAVLRRCGAQVNRLCREDCVNTAIQLLDLS